MSAEEMISPVVVGPSTVNPDNPWPGLLAFREADQGYFQGRKTETEELFRLVMRERLTVLFGLSGLGKSSLLQAGLFPMLRRESVFPVYIRLDFSAAEPDLVGEVKDDVAAKPRPFRSKRQQPKQTRLFGSTFIARTTTFRIPQPSSNAAPGFRSVRRDFYSWMRGREPGTGDRNSSNSWPTWWKAAHPHRSKPGLTITPMRRVRSPSRVIITRSC